MPEVIVAPASNNKVADNENVSRNYFSLIVTFVRPTSFLWRVHSDR